MAKKYVIRKPDGEIVGEEEKKSKKKEKSAARQNAIYSIQSDGGYPFES